MREIWDQLEEYPNFAVSDQGEVMNLKTKHILRTRRGFGGHRIVNLSYEGQTSTRSVGALVAATFRPEEHDDIFDTVIFLNGDKMDCRAENLLWRPRWFAIRYHRQFRDPVLGFEYPIYCVDTDEVFENCMLAATTYGMLQTEIFQDINNQNGVWPYRYIFKPFR